MISDQTKNNIPYQYYFERIINKKKGAGFCGYLEQQQQQQQNGRPPI